MKYNEVYLKYTRTIQMRSFEPVVLEGTVRVQVDPGDNINKVFIAAKKALRDQIDDEIDKLKVIRKESFTDDDGLDKVT